MCGPIKQNVDFSLWPIQPAPSHRHIDTPESPTFEKISFLDQSPIHISSEASLHKKPWSQRKIEIKELHNLPHFYEMFVENPEQLYELLCQEWKEDPVGLHKSCTKICHDAVKWRDEALLSYFSNKLPEAEQARWYSDLFHQWLADGNHLPALKLWETHWEKIGVFVFDRSLSPTASTKNHAFEDLLLLLFVVGSHRTSSESNLLSSSCFVKQLRTTLVKYLEQIDDHPLFLCYDQKKACFRQKARTSIKKLLSQPIFFFFHALAGCIDASKLPVEQVGRPFSFDEETSSWTPLQILLLLELSEGSISPPVSPTASQQNEPLFVYSHKPISFLQKRLRKRLERYPTDSHTLGWLVALTSLTPELVQQLHKHQLIDQKRLAPVMTKAIAFQLEVALRKGAEAFSSLVELLDPQKALVTTTNLVCCLAQLGQVKHPLWLRYAAATLGIPQEIANWKWLSLEESIQLPWYRRKLYQELFQIGQKEFSLSPEYLYEALRLSSRRRSPYVRLDQLFQAQFNRLPVSRHSWFSNLDDPLVRYLVAFSS